MRFIIKIQYPTFEFSPMDFLKMRFEILKILEESRVTEGAQSLRKSVEMPSLVVNIEGVAISFDSYVAIVGLGALGLDVLVMIWLAAISKITITSIWSSPK